MVRTIRLDTIQQVMELLEEQNYDQKIDRFRSPYYYIGLPDSAFSLKTSLERNCKYLSKTLEPSLLRSFTKYAVIDETSKEYKITSFESAFVTAKVTSIGKEAVKGCK